MSQTLSDWFSIDQIARFWAAENKNTAFGAEDIAEELLKAAESGEFEHPTHSRADAPLGEYTYEEPQQDGTVEIRKTEQPGVGPYLSALRMRGKQPVNGAAIRNYINARQTAPGATDRETRRIIAREVFLSVEGFRRWCDEPEFAERAQLRGLSRPRFIEMACGDGTGQASAVVQEPEEADVPSPSKQRKKPAKPMHDRWVERAKELKGLNPGILTSAIASKLRNEDLRFNELNMKSKGSDKMRAIRDTQTIRRVLTTRQKEWDSPQES